MICSHRIYLFYFQTNSLIVCSNSVLQTQLHSQTSACLYDRSIKYNFLRDLPFYSGIEASNYLSLCSLLTNLYIFAIEIYTMETAMTYYNLKMAFGVSDLPKLSLNRQSVPVYEGVAGKRFPQRIPATLVVLCFVNSLVKLLTPLILEQTYSSISGTNMDTVQYVTLISVVIFSIALSQLILIAYGLMLSLYTLNVKRELSSRILKNNFRDYRQLLQSPNISQKTNSFSMDLSIKISTKLSVYLHNYYESYLSLIFQCFNIAVIFIYLLYKLSFSLFFGVAIAGVLMYKTIKITNTMQSIRFQNIALRAKRLKILQQFFNRITQYKMCWLDKWIYDKITKIQHQFQNGLRKTKLLDCWCVAAWQFTSVGISSIVITAYFLCGFNQTVDKQSVFTPSTFVYLLNMLNFPLNALSWYIAGIKTAQRAIKEIESDIRLQADKPSEYKKIQEGQNCYLITEPITLLIKHEQDSQKQNKRIEIPVKQISKGKIYSVRGAHAEEFMDKLIFLFQDTINLGFVQQNAWLSSSPLQTFRMEHNLVSLQKQNKSQILSLMELFQCADIPLHTSTKNYSGGQKLRISLVRAFHLGQLIVINTNLDSLDTKMQQIVKQNIRKLVSRCFSQLTTEFTVFIRDNQDIADFKVTLVESQNTITPIFSTNDDIVIIQEEIRKINLSHQIQKYNEDIKTSIEKAKQKINTKNRRYSIDKLQQINEMQQKSVVSWDTFKIYYTSKKHIVFVVSLIFVTLISNYYNYYINTYIEFTSYDHGQVITILVITVIFAIGLYFRSFYFADANLDESVRICHNLNKNIIMNELSYYDSQEVIHQDSNSAHGKSKMICALTSDTETISDQFPFSTNIFANNITVIISSMIVIIIEVPPAIVIMVFLVIYANKLNKISHKKDEYLKITMKEKDVDIYHTISEIEGGRKYVIIHNKLNTFSSQFAKYQQQLYSLDWLSSKFKNYINLKYKMVMTLFLIVAVVLYSFMNVFTSTEDSLLSSSVTQTSKSSSGLALLIQYTIQLSNYLLFFTMSIWEIKGQAVSLQRIRPYIETTKQLQNRTIAADKIIEKLIVNKKQTTAENIQNSQPLIDIKGLDFSYQKNPNLLIFSKLTLSIKKGDKIMIRGRSGVGKTTLYKLLSSAYPKIMNYVQAPFLIYFSPQHPLILPDTQTVQQNINPYNIDINQRDIAKLQVKYQLQPNKPIKQLNYEQKIIINNLRAYLYGGNGIIIYDQPQIVIQDDPNSTYLIVTHHREFKHNVNLELENGSLIKK